MAKPNIQIDRFAPIFPSYPYLFPAKDVVALRRVLFGTELCFTTGSKESTSCNRKAFCPFSSMCGGGKESLI